MNSLLADSGYKLPSDNILEIFDKPALPYFHFIPFNNLGLEMTYQSKQTLEQLVDPTVKLAGSVISIRLNAQIDNYPRSTLKIHNFLKEKEIEVKFDKDIKIRDYKLSPDNSKIAISEETETGVKLIIVFNDTGKIVKFPDLQINDVFRDGGFFWLNDSEHLIVKSIPSDRGVMPEKPLIPGSPVIEETSGVYSTTRTYQHLLKNRHDEELFDHFFTSQVLLLDIDSKKTKKLNEPAIYDVVLPSPDNEYILIEKICLPYSYQVPHFRFPRKFLIWNKKGHELRQIHDRPLQDQIPIGGTYKGPRRFQWQVLKDAALIWVEALDDGIS